nr:hypothetical protein Iba_chr09bCG3400 [Ipomoea batatas]GME16545.1 hypothetical protein Iba_scaffold17644CG0060 [Ipomoea batatas]
MSRNDTRPRRAFSRRYLATQEFDASLSSATASAMSGSPLFFAIVDLTFPITSVVSFTYSSSEAARAAGAATRIAGERTPAARERNSRRVGSVAVAAAEEFEAEMSLDLMGVRRGLGVEVVGVIRVGEAMDSGEVLGKERGRRREEVMVDEEKREIWKVKWDFATDTRLHFHTSMTDLGEYPWFNARDRVKQLAST